MNFLSDDPGAAQFGNFINYYTFHSAEERSKLLPDDGDVWLPPEDYEQKDPYYVLDIGCNTGVLTHMLWKHLTTIMPQREVYILGIDIDPVLIERAIDANANPDRVTFSRVDVMTNSDFEDVLEYLKKCDRTKFDAICCFSITMWIHLNWNDDGLQKFLRKCSTIAKLFLIEPQPWRCYKTAMRRMRKAGGKFPYSESIQWRQRVEDEIEKYLLVQLDRRKIYETKPTNWQRKISFYC